MSYLPRHSNPTVGDNKENIENGVSLLKAEIWGCLLGVEAAGMEFGRAHSDIREDED